MADKKSTSPKAGNNAGDVKPAGPDVDVKLQRELYEKEKKVEEQESEIAKLRAQLEEKNATQAPQMSDAERELNDMRIRIDQLSRQVVQGVKGDKLLFRSPTAADLTEPITFTARTVFYVVASYRDNHGIEQLPPHKLIIFTYQASDIRKEGKEDVIKNFSQFTTNLRTEIEFLRKHPHYGITFSENTNEMMDEDIKFMSFRTSAATLVAALPPEGVYARAEQYKIANFRNKSAEELRSLVVQKMAEEFKKEADKLQDDILRRRLLASSVFSNKEE
jgi:hypothetical protein